MATDLGRPGRTAGRTPAASRRATRLPRPTPAELTDVPASRELVAPLRSGVELCYQTFGSPEAEPLLLVMGLGGPMTWWDEGLCRRLAHQGFFVVRYDNRDVGRSSRMSGRVSRLGLVRGFLGLGLDAPYRMSDLADDAVGLLDHLEISAAHVVGVSMGGMIAQSVAIAAPHRVVSLTSMSSTTGRRTVGRQSITLLPNLLASRGPGREAYVESSLVIWRRIGSPGYPEPEEVRRERAGETFDRGVSASGVLRQMGAILTQPDRTAALRQVRVPTLVVHGLSDPLVNVSGGRATAAAVPGSELLLVQGMAHDMPTPLHPLFAEAIRRNADRA